MDIDPEYLRRYYSELSDEGIMEINRADLVEAAQSCYDNELRVRKLQSPAEALALPAPRHGEGDAGREIDSDGEQEPAWLEESAEVYSVDTRVGSGVGEEAERARSVLETAGIQCYLDFCEDPPEESTPGPTHRWRVLVPGKLNMRAASILDRDIFNNEFVTVWKTHLETLSDQDLSDADPKEYFCGLFDRVERLVGAYSDELSRRGRRAYRS